MVGYATMSAREGQQGLDRQLDALRAAGCERVFKDRGSAATCDRRGLNACLQSLHRGDVLVVLGLDRLGRRTGELIGLVVELQSRGIAFCALNTAFDTTGPSGRAFLQIQAALAEMERNLIRERISEGIAAAQARGRQTGRPRVMTAEKLRCAQHLMADRGRSVSAICHELGDMPVSTLYHYLHADGSLKAPGRTLLGTQSRAGQNVRSGTAVDVAPVDVRRARAVA
jgi:DNA invertase Pin-like site-specific DNA recombinase